MTQISKDLLSPAGENQSSVRVAVVQMTPAFMDNNATLHSMEVVLTKLKDQGCQLALFPESLLPGYPRGFTFGTTVGNRTSGGRDLWHRFHQVSIKEGDHVCAALADLARRFGLYLIIGVTEKDSINSSLYCSMFYFNPEGLLVGKHRKIKPTAAERLIWAEGDGTSIRSITTPIGRLGGLICWENYMPQARVRLYQSGLDIYLAPTADARPSWLSSMQHIACESRSYVLSSNQFFQKDDYSEEFQRLLEDKSTATLCRGGSCIVSPYGELLAGPIYDREGYSLAEIDLGEVVKSRMDFDPIGHYTRNDLFPVSNNQ
ncbi:MAG: carbon-nitrogen hydrolase family protein [Saprospiraceae bacterium]|nr:carbon-nitrogen hydrolase family protein [Saprospiraceae bacterium]